MEYFGTVTDRFAEGWRADWQNHELLQINAVISMRTAVDDVHHGYRQNKFAGFVQEFVQRYAGFLCSSARGSHGNTQNGVSTNAAFAWSTIQSNHFFVQRSLVVGIHTDDRFANFGIDEVNSVQYTFTQIASFVTVAQFDCFAFAGGGTGGHHRTADDAGCQIHFRFNSRITA